MIVKSKKFLLIQSLVLISLAFCLPVFSKQVCIKNSLDKKACGELIPNTDSSVNSPPDPNMTIRTKAGLNFTLKNCRKSREGLNCFIDVYNSTDFDKKMSIARQYPHFIINSEVNEYSAHTTLGNNRTVFATMPPKSKIESQIFIRPNGLPTDSIRILKISPIIENSVIDVTFRDFHVR